MDKIALPQPNEQIPYTLFEIRDLIKLKLPANPEQYEFLQTYVKELKDCDKYDISTRSLDSSDKPPEH